jgi:hypothetical protein
MASIEKLLEQFNNISKRDIKAPDGEVDLLISMEYVE